MIIAPKQPRNDKTHSRLSRLVPYMLRGKGEERCTWYKAGNLPGLERQENAGLAVEVVERLQEGNTRAKGSKTCHVVISFHPEDRRLTPAEPDDDVCRTAAAAGLGEHQYIAVRLSEQEHEHLQVAVNKIHPQTLKIHHLYKVIPAFQVLASILEQELGLHCVDRTRSRSESHRAATSSRIGASRVSQAGRVERQETPSTLHGVTARSSGRRRPRGFRQPAPRTQSASS